MLRTKQYSRFIFNHEFFKTSFFETDFKKNCLLLSYYSDSCAFSRLRLLLQADYRIVGERFSFLTFSYVNGVNSTLLIG